MQVKANQNQIMSAKIIRKDGTVIDLGVIVGGSFLQKIKAWFRIKLTNIQAWQQR